MAASRMPAPSSADRASFAAYQAYDKRSFGGGVYNERALTLTNSTVSGNTADQGGGIFGAVTLYNSTVSGNSADLATGGIVGGNQLVARGSIIAGNQQGDLSGYVVSQGYNLFGTGGAGPYDPTDLLNVDPLQDNGGPTQTMYPLPGSPVVDYIPGTAGVDFPTTDQRGVARRQGRQADIGAVEVEPFGPSVNKLARELLLRERSSVACTSHRVFTGVRWTFVSGISASCLRTAH
jgi:hypothetical protein